MNNYSSPLAKSSAPRKQTPISPSAPQQTPLSLGQSLSVRLIHGYQRHLSPRKGFACAHRLYHGGTSCSAYTKQVILEQGLSDALPLIRQRFTDCKQANQWLRTQNSSRRRRRGHKRPDCDCDSCLFGIEGCDCGLDLLDCSGFDCNGLDCGGADCGGCDGGSCW